MSNSSTPELTNLKNSNTVYQTYYFKKSFRENYAGVGQKGGIERLVIKKISASRNEF